MHPIKIYHRHYNISSTYEDYRIADFRSLFLQSLQQEQPSEQTVPSTEYMLEQLQQQGYWVSKPDQIMLCSNKETELVALGEPARSEAEAEIPAAEPAKKKTPPKPRYPISEVSSGRYVKKYGE